jgi:hypothetical protein
MKTWTDAAEGRFSMRRVETAEAPMRVRFVRGDGIYGETRPRLDDRMTFIDRADVLINAEVPGDALNQQLIIYLTALHEIGHALGLPHSDNFSAIMYAFRRPDDGERYFGNYRRRLRSAADIGTPAATGLAAEDVQILRELYDR